MLCLLCKVMLEQDFWCRASSQLLCQENSGVLVPFYVTGGVNLP